MKSLHALLTTTLMLFFAWQGMRGQEPSSCGCQGGSDVTTTITLCIAGTNYNASVTRCEKLHIADPNLADPCDPNLRPDAVTFFKKICLDSTVNFNIDSVLAAIVCYHDPCKGNGIGASVPTCDGSPGAVYCWSYGFPRCWTRTSAECYQVCGPNNNCCWRSRVYCINASTGKCGLWPGGANDWSCAHTTACNGNCITATTCTPAPACNTCTA